MKEIVGVRLLLGMGVVNDTKFTRCFWPRLDKPTEVFAKGSSGLVIEGPPTPRNIIFPSDTVFIDTRDDCHFLRDGDYVSILTKQQADDVVSGKSNPEGLLLDAVFVSIAQSLDDSDLKVFRLTDGVMTDVTALFEVA